MRKFLSNPFRLAGFCIFAFFSVHLLLLVGRVYGPPFVERFCGLIQGMSTTPFFMESGFVIFGFLCVFAINYFRRKWDGEEMVYLDMNAPADATDAPKDQLTLALQLISEVVEQQDKPRAQRLFNSLTEEQQRTQEALALRTKIRALEDKKE